MDINPVEDLGQIIAKEIEITSLVSFSDINILVGEVIGTGAIPVKGRHKKKAPCNCCKIDPHGPNEPANRLCTTSGAIGTLSQQEQVDWCSKIHVVESELCKRAALVRSTAADCKSRFQGDVHGFFNCFANAFEPVPLEKDLFASVS